MSDMGMMFDLPSLQAALTEAHSSIRKLWSFQRIPYLHDTTWNDQKSWDDMPLDVLERASFNLHQLSTLLDLHIQERSATARPQEEANDSTRSTGAPRTDASDPTNTANPSVDGVDGPGEGVGPRHPDIR